MSVLTAYWDPEAPMVIPVIRSIKGCARCGQDHPELAFLPLTNASDEWNRWSPCPVTKEPILLRTVPVAALLTKEQTPELPVRAFAWEDINFFCHAWPYDEHRCSLNVKVWEIIGKEPDGRFVFNKADSPTSPNPVYSTDEAELYLSGFLKWDTCSNFRFDHQENVMLHFCSRREATNIGILFDRLYDLAAEMLSSWDE